MRSRTELVTTKIEGSDYEDESDFEDSEEDWQPEKDEKAPKRGRAVVVGRQTKSATKKNGKGKPAASGGRKAPIKKVKEPSSDEEEEEEDEDEEELEGEVEEEENEEDSEGDAPVMKKPKTEVKTEASSSSSTATSSTTTSKSIQRKPVSAPPKSIPEKNGILSLYVFKGDLKDGVKDNEKLCLWRRDGSSLLQKYMRDKSVTTGNPHFTSSMVYSCWEDRRASEYLEVQVKCLNLAKQIKVELMDSEELEKSSKDEYEKHIAVHGVPVPRNNNNESTASAAGNEEAEEEEEGEEEDEENDDPAQEE